MKQTYHLSPGAETVGRGRFSPGRGEGALGPSPKQEGRAAFVHLGPLVDFGSGPLAPEGFPGTLWHQAESEAAAWNLLVSAVSGLPGLGQT